MSGSTSPSQGEKTGSTPVFRSMNIDTQNQVLSTSPKLRLGWFSFSCCEDNTVVMTEVMNDYWQDWKKMIDFRYAKALKSKNVLDELDVAFVEGAVSSEDQINKLKEIRQKSKVLVATGSCAVTGLPSGARNQFNEQTNKEIQYLLFRFEYLPKVLKISDVVQVDYTLPGCPMIPKDFINVVDKMLKEFNIRSL